jgi:CRP-like cAMP-binding protein
MTLLVTPELLLRFPLFNALGQDQLNQLLEKVEIRTATRQSPVYESDQPCQYLFLLLQGMVKIGTYFTPNREVVRGIVPPGAIFGECGLSGAKVYQEFACALNVPIQYLAVPVDVCEQLMRDDFNFFQAVLGFVGERLRRAERHLESMVIHDVRTRIIGFLRENTALYGDEAGLETLVRHGLTQQDIANIVGASRQTVAIILNELRKQQQIEFDRDQIVVHSLVG